MDPTSETIIPTQILRSIRSLRTVLALGLFVCTVSGFASDSHEFAEPKKIVLKDMIWIPTSNSFFIDVFEANGYVDPQQDTKPAGYERIADAKIFCESQGKRLPTLDEWMAAASDLGKNKNFTLIGDTILDSNNALKANIVRSRSGGSQLTRDWKNVGIDSVGTVGMTGNRAEWVQDGDRVYQCGGGYEDMDVNDIRLDKICSQENEGRWRRRDKSATARCVMTHQPSNRVELQYSSFVNGWLKDWIDRYTNKPVTTSNLTYYEALRDRCKKDIGIDWVGPAKDPLLNEERMYPLMLISDGKDSLYFDCTVFGVESRVPFKSLWIDALTFKIPEEALKTWRKNTIFRDNSYSKPESFLKTIAELNGETLLRSLVSFPSEKIKNYAALNRLQEISWELAAIGKPRESELVYRMLKFKMEKAKMLNATPFKIGNVSETFKVQLEGGIDAVFKPTLSNLENYKAEVAASRIDYRLGLQLVPVTVLRVNDAGREGALMYWVNDAKTARELGWPLERYRGDAIHLLDELIRNVDRHYQNFLFIENGCRIVAVDHNRSCSATIAESYQRTPAQKLPSRAVYDRLVAFNDSEIENELRDLLPADAILMIQTQRLGILNRVNQQIISGGDAAAFEN